MMLKLTLSLAVLMDFAGSVTLNCDSTKPENEGSMTCTCTNPTKNGIEWRFDSAPVTSCSGSSDSCFPVLPGYTSDVSKDEFYAEYNPYTYSDCGNYSCKDGSDEATVTTYITEFNSSAPSALTEPGSNEDGKIEITTNCLFKDSDITVKWYTIDSKNGRTREYEPDTTYSIRSDCADATKVCNGVKAARLNIGFEHKEKSFNCVKFKLEVYHSANVADKLELTTSAEYCIDRFDCPAMEGNELIDTEVECFCLLTFIGIVLLVIAEILSFMVVGWLLYWKSGKYGCCDVNGQLPVWMQRWWQKVIFVGIFIVYLLWRKNQGNGDVKPKEEKPRHGTQSGNTRTGPKKPETKKNESKDLVAHIENEQHNQGRKHREQPPPPSDAGAATGTTLHGREDSDSAVSREHVHIQESGRTLPQRPMPGIPSANDRQGHDSKGRGLSATFNDEEHPLVAIDTPSQKKGALESLPEGTGGEGSVKKLKKKKKKSKDREDEM